MTVAQARTLVEHFEHGLESPICLTWELTYACNLACVHCLSSSGRRDPREQGGALLRPEFACRALALSYRLRCDHAASHY